MTQQIRIKRHRKPLHGIILLDKPIGFSSNQALQKVKWLLGAEKAGHTGTLDPLATGVLPLCFGAATKFSQLHLDANKTYTAIAKLGETTTTYDVEGQVVQKRPVEPLTQQLLEQVTRHFTGQIQQKPPLYSALKKDGKALYEYARAGQQIEVASRTVHIKQLQIAPISLENGQTALKLHTVCSKGTYIRSLVADIGEFLGCGAHVLQLRRIATGYFTEQQCINLEQLEQLSQQQREQQLLAVDTLLNELPKVKLPADEAGRFLTGLRRSVALPNQALVQVWGTEPEVFLGTASIKAEQLIPARLLNPQEIQQVLLQVAK